MKQRSLLSLLAVGVIVLLLAGIGGYYWFGLRNPLSSLRQPEIKHNPVATMFVPKQASAIASLLVNPDRIQQWAPGKMRDDLNEFKSTLLANTGLDYRRDIQPWLDDEITVAVTTKDVDQNERNGQQPGYLIALATKNARLSREFLQVLFSQQAIAATEIDFEEYNGVPVIYRQSRRTPTQPEMARTVRNEFLAGAVVGDRFVLIANHPTVLKDAINNAQAEDLNLNNSTTYQQALELLPSNRIGLAFLQLPTASGADKNELISLELNRQGLLAQTMLLTPPASETPTRTAPLTNDIIGALRYIPVTAGLAISSVDLNHWQETDVNLLWQQVTGGLLDAQAINRSLKSLQDSWGIDLQQDIFSWVEGEYALGMLPHTDQTAADWVFVTETSEAAQQGISHLDAIAQEKGFSITALPLEAQKIFAWTQLTTAPTKSAYASDEGLISIKAKVLGVHATVDKYEILTTSVEAMDAAIKAIDSGLVNDAKFKESIDVIPKPNAGYVYVDWKDAQEIFNRQLPILKLIEVGGKPFFDNLRSLTISTYGSDTGLLKSGILFRFQD